MTLSWKGDMLETGEDEGLSTHFDPHLTRDSGYHSPGRQTIDQRPSDFNLEEDFGTNTISSSLFVAPEALSSRGSASHTQPPSSQTSVFLNRRDYHSDIHVQNSFYGDADALLPELPLQDHSSLFLPPLDSWEPLLFDKIDTTENEVTVPLTDEEQDANRPAKANLDEAPLSGDFLDASVESKTIEFIKDWLARFPGKFPSKQKIASLANLTSLKPVVVERLLSNILQESLSISSKDQQTFRSIETTSRNFQDKTLDPETPYTREQRTLREAAEWVAEHIHLCTHRETKGDMPKRYRCTLGCGSKFSRKYEWKRHEEEVYPQEGYLCFLCDQKPMGPGRISYRKEHFVKHLKRVHNMVSNVGSLSHNRFVVQSKFPRQCDFCSDYHFHDWRDRIDHLASRHLEASGIVPRRRSQSIMRVSSSVEKTQDYEHFDQDETLCLDGAADCGSEDESGQVRPAVKGDPNPNAVLSPHESASKFQFSKSNHGIINTHQSICNDSGSSREIVASKTLNMMGKTKALSASRSMDSNSPSTLDPELCQPYLPCPTIQVQTANQLTSLQLACRRVSEWTLYPALQAAKRIQTAIYGGSSKFNGSQSEVSVSDLNARASGSNTKLSDSYDNLAAVLPSVLVNSQQLGSDFTVITLKEKLLHASLRENDYRAFIPINTFDQIITRESIIQELRGPPSSQTYDSRKTIADTVLRTSRRLFAVLSIIGKSQSITDFFAENISDVDLPFRRLRNDPHSGTINNLAQSSLGHSINTFNNWTQWDVYQFCREQWCVLAPVFDKEAKHYDLDDNCVLPLISLSSNPSIDLPLKKYSGGYSEVYPVRIHPAHHNFWTIDHDAHEPFIAVKKLFSSDEEPFRKEANMLKALGTTKHPHLIKLLATYRYNSKYHLLFPWANGNLRKYWKNDPPVDPDGIRWTLDQMCGIASALQVIHNFRTSLPLSTNVRPSKNVKLKVSCEEEVFGWHGDIKPENILWFNGMNDSGTLQIADLGLGRFHRLETRSRIDPQSIGGTPTYMPPELVLGKDISRAYDIWSLGCVFLEFVTWVLEGGNGVEKFAEARMDKAWDGVYDDSFYDILRAQDKCGMEEARVRTGVVLWMETLCKHRKCSGSFLDLISLIRSRLIVANPADRAPSTEVVRILEGIVRRARSDEQYLMGGSSLVRFPSPPAKKLRHYRSSSKDSGTKSVKIKKRRTFHEVLPSSIPTSSSEQP